MSLQAFTDVAEAPDAHALQSELVKFAHRLDFGIITTALIVAPASLYDEGQYFHVDNVPKGFEELSLSKEDAKRDPVFQRLRDTSTPFVYDQKTYVDARAADLWERQAEFGFRSGIQVGLHLPSNRHFFLGMDTDRALPKRPDALSRLMADMQLLAVHAQEAACRIFTPEIDAALPKLTVREAEILRWTIEGKSAAVVGQLIGLSVDGVNHHFRSIFRKLEVSNKQQAAIKATSLGLL